MTDKITHEPYKEDELDKEFLKILEKYRKTDYSAEEINLRIEVDKVIYVLSRFLSKLHLLANLPYILDNNCAILKKYFKKFDFYYITDVLGYFDTSYIKHSVNDPDYIDYVQVLKKLLLEKHSVEFENSVTVDPQVYQILDMLFYNKCLKAAIQMSQNAHTNDTVMKFLKIFQNFKNIVRESFYISGDKQIQIDKQLRNAYKTVNLQSVTIKGLQDQIEKQRKELGNQLKSKVEIFEMYNKKIKKIQDNFQIQTTNELHESEKNMMHASVNSEQIQAEVAEEAKRVTRQYDLLLEDDLAQEKASRSRRMKLESQLQNWLTTYDQDIGDKQSEYETLYKDYTNKKSSLEELLQKIDDQEEEYNILMEEKRIEEERIFNEMAYQFLMNRSARIIQRFWRQYRERRQARKKGKKGKGKGKDSRRNFKAPKPVVTRKTDVTALLESDKKIKSHVFEELTTDADVFNKEN